MKTILVLILSMASCVLSFGQYRYFVSPNGNNSNDGSHASPWQTIQYSLDQLSPNDTLFVLGGIYHEKINIPVDSIVLCSYDASPIIDATGITGQNPIIRISSKNNIGIYSIELRNNIQNDAQGILIEGTSSNIEIGYCSIHDIHFSADLNDTVSDTTNAQGIIVYGTDANTPITNVTIIKCKLYNCRLGYSEGIAINGNVDGFQVLDNYVHDLTNIGIDVIGHEGTCPDPLNDQARNGYVSLNTVYNCISPYATSGGIYVDGAKNITIQRNQSYHNGYGIEVGCENVGTTTDSIVVSSNFMWNNEHSAIALGGYDYPSGSGKVTRSFIRNNTCYASDSLNSGLGELYLTYSENCVIENNIFYTSDQDILSYAELNQPSLIFDYNLVYNVGGEANTSIDWNGTSYSGFFDFVAGSGTNAHSIFENPLFQLPVSWSSYWGGLPLGSPAINAGNPAYIPNSHEMDYSGGVRMEQGRIDCGADEYGNTVGIIEKIENSFLIYPNPATQSITLLTGQPIEQYEIYSLAGEKIITGAGKTSIDVSGLNAGMYFVRVYSGNSVSVEKFEKR